MSHKLSCIIVEDETLARKSLETLCGKSDHIELISSFENAEDAQKIFLDKKVDLILLDIEMPGMSGLDLIEKLPYVPQIVFTTSNKEYAYQAYEYDITDFLKKPISQLRFFKAIEKVVERNARLNAIASLSSENEIYIKVDKKYIRIPYDEIEYFENVGDYVKVVTPKKTHIIHGSLKSIDNRLKHPRLLKVHRSFIINLSKIKDIEDNTVLIKDKVIPVSRAHKPILMSSINFL